MRTTETRRTRRPHGENKREPRKHGRHGSNTEGGYGLLGQFFSQQHTDTIPVSWFDLFSSVLLRVWPSPTFQRELAGVLLTTSLLLSSVQPPCSPWLRGSPLFL